MDREEFSELIKEVVGDLLETHLAGVHEEITDVRAVVTGVQGELNELRQEVRGGFGSLKNEIGGVHNRIDTEVFARKDLEHRIRKALPELPEVTPAQ